MEVTDVLARLGGVSSRGRLIALTGRAQVDAALATGLVVRDARGRYALPTADEAHRAANSLSGVVSHRSAAAAWGWELKQQPDLPTVTVPRNRNVPPGRRAGVEVRWSELRPEEVLSGRTTQGRTVVDCARTLPFDEALAVADSALRHASITRPRLVALAEEVPTRGRRAALRVARHADGRAANPFESVLRALSLEVRALHLVPQLVIRDSGLVVRPDLVDESLRLVVEADSFGFHADRRSLRRDCERYNALVLRGWTVLRFTWEHVMFAPEHVVETLAAAASLRPPRPGAVAGRAIPAPRARFTA